MLRGRARDRGKRTGNRIVDRQVSTADIEIGGQELESALIDAIAEPRE